MVCCFYRGVPKCNMLVISTYMNYMYHDFQLWTKSSWSDCFFPSCTSLLYLGLLPSDTLLYELSSVQFLNRSCFSVCVVYQEGGIRVKTSLLKYDAQNWCSSLAKRLPKPSGPEVLIHVFCKARSSLYFWLQLVRKCESCCNFCFVSSELE